MSAQVYDCEHVTPKVSTSYYPNAPSMLLEQVRVSTESAGHHGTKSSAMNIRVLISFSASPPHCCDLLGERSHRVVALQRRREYMKRWRIAHGQGTADSYMARKARERRLAIQNVANGGVVATNNDT